MAVKEYLQIKGILLFNRARLLLCLKNFLGGQSFLLYIFVSK